MICIACPKSKHGKSRRIWPYLKRRFTDAGLDVRWIETEKPGHATDIARKAAISHREKNIGKPIVAVGGDGTINEVLNGLLDVDSDSPMGVLYTGTSPDFCRFHQIPIDASGAVDTLLAGKTKRVDTILAKYHDVSGKEKKAYVGCSCNIGLGAAVARFANRYRRFLGDFPGTLTGVLRAFFANHPIDLTIELDGEDHRLPECNHLMLIKNPHIASGLRLDLPLAVDDEQAYMLAVHDRGRLGLCRELPKFYTGRVTDSKTLLLKPFRKATIRATIPSDTIEVEYDGDPRGFLPLEAELIPRNLKIIGSNNA